MFQLFLSETFCKHSYLSRVVRQYILVDIMARNSYQLGSFIQLTTVLLLTKKPFETYKIPSASHRVQIYYDVEFVIDIDFDKLIEEVKHISWESTILKYSCFCEKNLVKSLIGQFKKSIKKNDINEIKQYANVFKYLIHNPRYGDKFRMLMIESKL